MEGPRRSHHRASRELASINLDLDSGRPASQLWCSSSDPAAAVLENSTATHGSCPMRFVCLRTRMLDRRFDDSGGTRKWAQRWVRLVGTGEHSNKRISFLAETLSKLWFIWVFYSIHFPNIWRVRPVWGVQWTKIGREKFRKNSFFIV
jgi:hypothetical protein